MESAKLEPGPAAVIPPAPAVPARPSSTERAAERLARLQSAIKSAKHHQREARDRQAAIVGHALINAMRGDDKVRLVVVGVLRRGVRRPADRAEIAALLIAGDAS